MSMPEPSPFADRDQPADVTVLVVTYRSEAAVDALIASLRRSGGPLRLRVIVADNASTDRTLEKLAAHADVTTVSTGGNLGYAAGINLAAAARTSTEEPILILNPDLEVAPDCIERLLVRMGAVGAAVVVPRIVDGAGVTHPSLRREPSLLGALGDALFGRRLGGRPAVLSEETLQAQAYRVAHRVDWATGAALLIDGRVAAEVGDWDESFFLYSEETDFFRRVRRLGGQVWYEPEALATHQGGGSGASLELDKLMVVNRVRYVRKYHGRGYASLYRGVVGLRELLRSASPRHRAILATVLDERSWPGLPGPTRDAATT
jgi:GT2 family glycosyltransferase